MKARISRNGRELSTNVVLADSMGKRMMGLLGRERLGEGESLWLKPCKGVHTVGMRFPIDVVFLDKQKVVIAINQDLRPNRMTLLHFRAASVLELPPGTLAATDARVGDRIEIA